MYNIVFCLVFVFVWCTCIAIYISVSYNGGLLPDIILLKSTTFNCPILIILLSQI